MPALKLQTTLGEPELKVVLPEHLSFVNGTHYFLELITINGGAKGMIVSLVPSLVHTGGLYERAATMLFGPEVLAGIMMSLLEASQGIALVNISDDEWSYICTVIFNSLTNYRDCTLSVVT